ncbi:hypothetical protein [Peribacillus sp. NPDC097895]|uniref:hypothetical protein n=1 Tax=Peribacillus sp. NPDC097895 TaxID=3390619 RepID=UPI003CFD2BE9
MDTTSLIIDHATILFQQLIVHKGKARLRVTAFSSMGSEMASLSDPGRRACVYLKMKFKGRMVAC